MPLNLCKSPLISAKSSFVSFPQCFLRCPSSWPQLCLNRSWFISFLAVGALRRPTLSITLLDLYAAQFGLFPLGQFNRQHAVLDCSNNLGRIDGGRNPERMRERPGHYFPKEVMAALTLLLLVLTFDG